MTIAKILNIFHKLLNIIYLSLWQLAHFLYYVVFSVEY